MKDWNRCRGCPGQCPENCSCCIFKYCVKPVDFALVEFHIHRACGFDSWFKEYFKYELSC